ncbi:MAG: hypothetical protein IJ398_06485 [Clostridia bacterium]|nr:hypothetical protein [Clostridia bacterium]
MGKENNKFISIIKSIDWKCGFLIFVFTQLVIFFISFFLSGAVNILIGFFVDVGLLKDFILIITFLILELFAKFLIFFCFFKNNRNLTFKQFCLNYSVTFVLRFVFSAILDFSSFFASASLASLGVLFANIFIDRDIVTTTQVPAFYYVLVFIVFEALTILVALLSNKIAVKQREKAKEELYKNRME